MDYGLLRIRAAAVMHGIESRRRSVRASALVTGKTESVESGLPLRHGA